MSRLVEIISTLKNNESRLIFKTEQNSLEITRSRPISHNTPESVGEQTSEVFLGETVLPQPMSVNLEPEFTKESSPEVQCLVDLHPVELPVSQAEIPPAPPPTSLPRRPQRFPCEYCSYSTDKKSNYNKHLRCVHFKEKFLCEICYRRFSNLSQHIRVSHLTSRSEMETKKKNDKLPKKSSTPENLTKTCEVKDNTFKEPKSSALDSDGSDSTEIPTFSCQNKEHDSEKNTTDKCDKTSTKKGKAANKKKFCEECNRWYSNFDQHFKIVHKKIKNFECVNCKKRFYDNRELRNHHLKSLQTGQCQQLTVNTEDRKHSCPQCTYRTNIKTNLNLHIESVHLKIKHTCVGCGLKLSSKSNLNNHMKNCKTFLSMNRVERDPKRILFQCKLCDYSTPRPSHLDRHILSVHKTEAFQTVTSVYEASTRPGTATPLNNSRIPFKLPQFVNLVNFDCIEGINFDNFLNDNDSQTNMGMEATLEPVTSATTTQPVIATEVYTAPQMSLDQPTSSQQNSNNFKSSLKITLQDLDVHDLDGIDLMPLVSEGDPENEKRTTEMVTQLMDILTGCESNRSVAEEKLGSCLQNI